jgi:hypothetical protein
VSELLASGLALQPQQSPFLARGEQPRHVKHLSIRQRHGMDHAAVHSDRWAKVGGDRGDGLFDAQRDMPAKSVPYQPSAGDPA